MTVDSLDPLLIRDAQSGLGKARDRLLEELYPRIYAYCIHLARGNPEMAMELAQESAFRLMRSLADLREPERLIPWAFRIATNLWRDRHRGRQDSPLPQEIEDSSLHESKDKEESLAEVRRRLDELPAPYRLVLTLRFLRGLDYEAMGQVLEAPQSTLRMQVARGIRLLRELIERRDHL